MFISYSLMDSASKEAWMVPSDNKHRFSRVFVPSRPPADALRRSPPRRPTPAVALDWSDLEACFCTVLSQWLLNIASATEEAGRER